MEKLRLRTGTHESLILLGEQIKNIRFYLPEGKIFVISDERVMSLYGQHFSEFPVILLEQGEKHKTLRSLEVITERLIQESCDRSSFLLGVGGGIICDITGFAASVYMRGIPFGFVSTTLLSQVDASVGGKNGVNFSGYKNILGVFNQPEFVICDPAVLKTLDQREFTGGIAEVLKAAAIRDEEFFGFLEEKMDLLTARNEEILGEAISRSVKIKADVVQRDEREKGERRILNFGHTFGHALEKHTGMPHGEAVSIGMVLAAVLSVKLGLLAQNEADRIITLLKRAGLPVQSPVPPALLAEAMTRDKKKESDTIHLVLLEKTGSAVNYPMKTNQLEELLHDLC
jgi:3-dehydroquinate synthase